MQTLHAAVDEQTPDSDSCLTENEARVIKSSTLTSYRCFLYSRLLLSKEFRICSLSHSLYLPVNKNKHVVNSNSQNSQVRVRKSVYSVCQTNLDYVKRLRYGERQDCVLWHIPLAEKCLSSPVTHGNSLSSVGPWHQWVSSRFDLPGKSTRFQQQWLLFSTPTADHCFSPLPKIEPPKAEASRHVLKVFPLRNYGMLEDAALLCFVTFFFLVFGEISGRSVTFTQGFAWWDLPCCETRKAQLTSMLWCISARSVFILMFYNLATASELQVQVSYVTFTSELYLKSLTYKVSKSFYSIVTCDPAPQSPTHSV